ncbi:MAG: M24 family metallopeptidase [Oscillospiraceae bacterium]|nr:M24 family metallopeptidase [Oscillospiraceae bacterium]
MNTVYQRVSKTYVDPGLRLAGIFKAQEIAKETTRQLASFLRPGLTYEEIREYAERTMLSLGSESFWSRNGRGALVLFGRLSAYSGHDDPDAAFASAGITVAQDDVVSVDLCPCVDGGWGDYTRSFFLVDGKVTAEDELAPGYFKDGMALERALHAEMIKFVDPGTTFEDLYYHISAMLADAGWRNLDYHDNFGHSIENFPEQRLTVARGVTEKIVEHGKPLSFEPHIARGDGDGIKHEDMYVWLDGRMQCI